MAASKLDLKPIPQGPIELRCEAHVCEAFELLGKRWTGLILALLLQRPARFGELAKAIPGISEMILSQRLQELQEAGVVERRDTLYTLTDRGQLLGPAVGQIEEWAAGLRSRR